MELKNWTLNVICINGKHRVNLYCTDCGMQLGLVYEPDVPLRWDVHRAIHKILNSPHTHEQCAAKKVEDKDALQLWDTKADCDVTRGSHWVGTEYQQVQQAENIADILNLLKKVMPEISKAIK